MGNRFTRALRRLAPRFGGLALGVTVATMVAQPVLAQAAGAVTGTIVDSKVGRPLPDAVIAIQGSAAGIRAPLGTTTLVTRSGTRGEFRLTTTATGTVTVTITRIGYKPATAQATVGGPAIQVELTELIVKLDELIVTGTVGDAQQRSLGNAIGRVAVAELTKLSPPAKLQDMLSVNVPGVRIMRASGAVGGGGTTRIRGSGSLSLSNVPLIYVDGVRVANADGAFSDAFNGQEAPSRINDLNPEEIESIEVLKGPSAATIYGTEASNGVIQIITKRGRAGRPTFDFHADAGVNWLQDPVGRYASNYYYSQVEKKVKEFNVLQHNIDIGRGTPFSNGTPIASGASLSGGTDQLRYYFSADFNRDEGAVTYNWQNKYAARANVSYNSSNDKFKVDFSLGQVRSKLRGASAFQPITTSILWACNFPGCEPSPNSPTTTGYNDAGHGYQFYRPEDYDMVRGFDNIDRTTVSLKLTHRPYSWLRQTLTVGPDLTNNKSSLEVELNADARRPFFSASNGTKFATQQRSTFLTLDYAVSGDWNVSKSLVASTAAGAQYYSKEFEFVRGTGENFSIPGGGNISSGAQIGALEGYQQNKTVGVYAQEQLAFKNRLFVTGALRGDDNSAFGSNFNAVYYPKVSASWVASEEGFLRDSKIFSQLKLRGAWGRAGNQPDVFSAIRTYQAKVGSQGLGGITPQNFGNANLKPEIGEELEAGFDAGLFNQRVGIEFTFYNKDIKDAILSLPLRPSRGFPGSQFLNIGKTRNRGIELGLDGSPVQTKNFSVDLRATLATNSSLILDMGGTPPAFTGGSFIQQYDVQGFAPSSFFFAKVVSSDVQTLNIGIPLPLGFNVKCEGGTDLGRGNGTVVDCAGAPRLYAGRPTPSWNGSFSATFTIGKKLRILGLVDAVGGNTSLVGDVAGVHSFFLSSKQALEGKDQILSGYLGLAILQGNGDAIGATGLTKGGFAKLRTVSASYDLPKKIAQFFGASRGSWTVAAENMAILWRAQKDIYGVKWIDPEIAANYSADRVGNNGYTQESWPQLARIRTTVRFTF